ncbi:MAG: hypothetical protein ACT4N2_04525 [Hyphomicrobium sp.]
MKFTSVKRMAAALLAFAALPALAAEPVNDFPTVTRGDYIFGCMQVNGNNRLVLERCACSIDVIAGLISHDEYVEAETIMSYRLKGGESTTPMFHQTSKDKVHKLKLAQLEGELKCF